MGLNIMGGQYTPLAQMSVSIRSYVSYVARGCFGVGSAISQRPIKPVEGAGHLPSCSLFREKYHQEKAIRGVSSPKAVQDSCSFDSIDESPREGAESQ